MTSSDSSQISKPVSAIELLIVGAALSSLLFFCGWWTYRHGSILYYGDAQAHLNISRSLLDSRAPGYDQLGTVWLPVLHLICLPLVQSTDLWASGLAGTIPVALCCLVAALSLYLTARHVHEDCWAGLIALACFVLNPNVLYLSVIPMTEIVFLAGLGLLLYCGSRFQSENRFGFLALAILASWWMSLTRYDGWFLIPFAATWFAFGARNRRWVTFLLFTSVASLAPLYWIGHSWWETANAIDFFNGPYSAKAIQQGRPYPGYHDWRNAFQYYFAAAQLCTGWGLVVLAAAGFTVIKNGRAFLPTVFLLLPCAFYIWSIHSSGNPIHVPQLWPFSYYNARYGIAFSFFAAFATSSLAAPLRSIRPRLALVIPLVSIAPWLIHPTAEHWICWKESQVNSEARRTWTQEAVRFVRANYRPGQQILAPFSDIAGVFCLSRTNLAEVLHEGGGPAWLATLKRPDLLHQQQWAISQQGDVLDRALTGSKGQAYILVEKITVKDAPTLHIYKRNN